MDVIIQYQNLVKLYFIKEDKYYGFGDNGNGQLGLENFDSQNIPQEIKFLSDKNIIDIQCGKDFTIALSSI